LSQTLPGMEFKQVATMRARVSADSPDPLMSNGHCIVEEEPSKKLSRAMARLGLFDRKCASGRLSDAIGLLVRIIITCRRDRCNLSIMEC
jgi:hypothetical protein